MYICRLECSVCLSGCSTNVDECVANGGIVMALAAY